LHYNASPMRDQNKDYLDSNGYVRLGLFYDHGNNTAGFVFEAGELERWVEEHQVDPVSYGEGIALRNWSDAFRGATGFDGRLSRLFVFDADLEPEVHLVIAENYDRFEVYALPGVIDISS